VQANFDAAITLNIGPFIASIQKAQAEVAKLSGQLDALNKKTLSSSVAPPRAGAMPNVGSGSTSRMNAASQEIGMQRQLEQAEKQRNQQTTTLQRTQAAQARDQQRNLARERYALYDVAAAYTMIAAAAAAAIVSTAGTAIQYERAFANVDRTTEFTSVKIGAAADSMKESLRSLASEIPVTFGQITQIATIGNQLGIAQGALVSFTETVAKFSATTGVGVESTAMSFGRIGELLQVDPADFEKLGSAIAFAGVNAVATEEQILSVTREIATTAKMANFSTPDIIGLSTALSSLGIAPEAARGSIIRTFAGINKAVSENGDALQNYAQIAGMPAEQFASTWQENGKVAFDSFLNGLQGLADNGENLDTVLRNLGMVNVRDIQTVQKLGDNYDVWASSIQDANQGFEEGAFLGEAYSKIQDTMASKLEILNNNFTNLKATLGEGAVATGLFGFGLKNVVEFLASVIKGLDDFAKSPIGSFVVGLAGVLVALTAAIAAINAVAALGRATMLAFATSMGVAKVSADGLTTSIDKAALRGAIFNNVLKAAGWMFVISTIIGGLSLLADAFTPVEQKASNLLGGFEGLQEALGADYATALAEYGDDAAVGLAIANEEILGQTVNVETNNEAVKKAAELQQGLAVIAGGALADGISEATDMIETQNIVLGENFNAWIASAIASNESFQNFAMDTAAMTALREINFDLQRAIEIAAAGGSVLNYIRELAYAAEATGTLSAESAVKLAGLLSMSNVPVFGDPLGDYASVIEGAVNQSWILGGIMGGVAKATEDAAEEGENLEESLDGAGKAMRTVVDYANDLRGVFSRAFEIRFGQQQSLDDIASGWNKIAEEAESAKEAIIEANAEINDLTVDKSILEYQLGVAERYKDEKRAASIRARLVKIDSSMNKATGKLADSTATLAKETEGNSKEAIDNRSAILGQLGSYTSLIEMYAKTGLKGAELEAKVDELKQSFIDQALQAGYSREKLEPYIKTFDDLKEAIQKTPRKVDIEFNSNVSPATQAVNEYLAKIAQADRTVNTNFTTTGRVDPNAARIQTLLAMTASLNQSIQRGELDVTGRRWTYAALFEINKELKELRGYADGGYVSGPGTSTSDSIPAMLSKGEYVIKASAVGAYGVDFMNAINQQKVGSFTASAPSQQSAGGSSVVYLSPDDRALLRAALDRPVNLYTENSKIASSANAGNVMLAQRGAR